MNVAIEITGLSKQYVLRGGDRTLRDALAGFARAPLRGLRRAIGREAAETFSALRDVDLSVAKGEVLGVIGRNGAGKSTLLKILSRVTEPTSGRAIVHGRLASLLEVGTGFHPELTGRENIYLNATILGMRRREIDGKFRDIVAFSGVERFLDVPVKHYSSGMYVRLAFAVAAHVDADVLLVDEVLAVGDAEFQKRCMGRMDDAAKSGRTVILVSHNAAALRNLCSEAVLLEAGQIVIRGPIDEVLAQYSERGRNAAVFRRRAAEGPQALAAVSGVAVSPVGVPTGGRIVLSRPFIIRVDVECAVAVEVAPFLHCYDADQAMVFTSGSFFESDLNGRVLTPGVHSFECEVSGHLFNDGVYTLDVMLVKDRRDVIASELSALSFEVIDDTPPVRGWNWRPRGAVRPRLAWRHSAA